MGVNHQTGQITDGGEYFSAADLIFVLASAQEAAIAAATTAKLPGASAVEQNLYDILGETVQVSRFGATPDNPDNTLSLTAAFSYAALYPGTELVLQAGQYKYAGSIPDIPPRTRITGRGSQHTVLLHESSTGDILHAKAAAGDECPGIQIRGLRLQSAVKKTAECSALHLLRCVRCVIEDVWADGPNGNGNLWHGFFFECTDTVHVTHFEACAQYDGIRVSGGRASGGIVPAKQGPGSSLFLSKGRSLNSAIGVHIGGGFGGVYLSEMDVGVNVNNLVIDTAISGTPNFEVFIAPTVTLDNCSDYGIIVDQQDGDPGFIGFSGTWVASSASGGMLVRNWNGRIVVAGGYWYNHGSSSYSNAQHANAITVQNPANTSVVVAAVRFQANTGYAVSCASADNDIVVQACSFGSNGLGNFDANTRAVLYTDKLRIDAQFGLYIQAENPVLNWDANTYDVFLRATQVRQKYLGDALVEETSSVRHSHKIPVEFGAYALTALPDATKLNNNYITVVGGTGGKRLAYSDGQTWRWVSNDAVVS